MQSDINSLEPTIIAFAWLGLCTVIIHYFILMTYHIRLIAIREFGTVIHECDPYFNYRATEYLYNNGYQKFFTWYDYKSWYPIGRPIGTTIYPGMQFTAVFIKKYIFKSMSINDICCYIPAWFAVIASLLVGMITYECTLECNANQSFIGVLWDLISKKKKEKEKNITQKTKNDSNSTMIHNNSSNKNRSGKQQQQQQHKQQHKQTSDQNNNEEDEELFIDLFSPATECSIAAMGIMGMVPAHLTRSIGGAYDNESVAMSTMCLTFYFWVRSLRANDDKSYLYGIATGVAYFYMAATWGGYIFVLNMIGLHAALLVILGRFSTKVYLSYSIFYVIGSLLATRIPIIGLAPFKSLEQVLPLLVFVAYQLIQYCQYKIKTKTMTNNQAWKFRVKVFFMACLVLILSVKLFIPKGYFGPISARVRGLFVTHTKTGNPLVDSVAEHQPADSLSYFRYLQHLCIFAPIGFILSLINFGDAASFVLLYAIVAYWFSVKMVRLILLLGPAASILSGIAVGRVITWSFYQLFLDFEEEEQDAKSESSSEVRQTMAQTIKKKKKSGKRSNFQKASTSNFVKNVFSTKDGSIIKRIVAIILVLVLSMFAMSFQNYCIKMSRILSNPSITMFGQKQDGSLVRVDDYREAYWWLRDNTPEDSRILAWWDYGYQITAIANRTTLADGNTWNHEHIALIGKILTANIDEGYSIARHLADYVLIWTGGGADDLAKSPHLARIANSVYRGQCPNDPTCNDFGFVDLEGNPSPMMEDSFLYQLYSHKLVDDVEVDSEKFEEVYKSKWGKVRIFRILNIDEDSRQFTFDPRNRVCDTPGSWFCRGQYPPALTEVLEQKQDFTQLEDFNSNRFDAEYQDQYFENLNKRKSSHRREKQNSKKGIEGNIVKPPVAEIALVNSIWEDTLETTKLWELITSGDVSELKYVLQADPILAFIRSSDGRGPMFWAFEHRRQDMVKVLMQIGVSHSERDKEGCTPVDLLDAPCGSN